MLIITTRPREIPWTKNPIPPTANTNHTKIVTIFSIQCPERMFAKIRSARLIGRNT
jgi:hypothetical protein